MPITEAEWSQGYKSSELALGATRIAFNEFIGQNSTKESSRSPAKNPHASLLSKKETPLTAARQRTGITSATSSSGSKFTSFSNRAEARRRRHWLNQSPAVGAEGKDFLSTLLRDTENLIVQSFNDACRKPRDQLDSLVKDICRKMGEDVSDSDEEQ